MKCAYLLLYEKDAIESISERKTESIPLLFITEGFWDLFFEVIVLSLQNASQNRILSEKLLESTSIVSFRRLFLTFSFTVQLLLPRFESFHSSFNNHSIAGFISTKLPDPPNH